jgi:hypothetical protein
MALEIIIIVLMGAMLGLRLKVLILVPAVTLTMLGAAVIGVARADPFWSVLVAMILFGTAVQFGYLAGLLTYAGIVSVRASGRRAVTTRKLGVSSPPSTSTSSLKEGRVEELSCRTTTSDFRGNSDHIRCGVERSQPHWQPHTDRR